MEAWHDEEKNHCDVYYNATLGRPATILKYGSAAGLLTLAGKLIDTIVRVSEATKDVFDNDQLPQEW